MTLAICLRAAVKTLREHELYMAKHVGYNDHKNAVDSAEQVANELETFAKSEPVASPRSRRRGKPQ